MFSLLGFQNVYQKLQRSMFMLCYNQKSFVALLNSDIGNIFTIFQIFYYNSRLPRHYAEKPTFQSQNMLDKFYYQLNLPLILEICFIYQFFKGYSSQLDQIAKKIKILFLMQNQKLFSAFQLQIYPLEFFILFVGFCIGISIGRLNQKCLTQQQAPEKQKVPILKTDPSIDKINNADASILSYSLSTGQSFEKDGLRAKLFRGHLYEYFHVLTPQSHQPSNTAFQVVKSGIVKMQKDGEWTKFYNSSVAMPKQGKFYFQVYIVKNQYFIKKEASQKASNVAVSRTDLIVGFFTAKQSQHSVKLNEQVKQIRRQSQKQSNNIEGISGYGLNGRIYNNGQLRVQEKIIKKNKALTVYINQEDGYIAYQVENQTVGFLIVPKNRPSLIPFVQMYAVGSSVIISS